MAQQEVTDLPKGWIRTRIGSFLKLKNGYAFKSADYIEAGKDTVPVIRISDVKVEGANSHNANHVSISKVIEGFEIERGDQLIAMSGATTGKVGVYQGVTPAYQNQRVGNLKLISDENFNKQFKNYLIKAKSQAILDAAYGGAQPNVSASGVEGIEVVIPPLQEQKRIVEKLDSLLTQVDTIQQRLNNLPNIIKRFRQSVLAAAVSGKLTEQWRVDNEYISKVKLNDANEKYVIPDDFPTFSVPDEWAFSPIGNVASFQQGMQIAKSTRYEEDGINRLPILKIGNYSTNFTKGVEFIGLNEQSLIAEKDDIILTRTGESRGRVLTGFRGVFHNNTFRINYDANLLQREYLIYALKNSCTLNYIREVSGRSAQPDLTHSKFGPCPISIPPLHEQTEIVRLVEQCFALANTLEKNLTNAKKRVDNLTQSILAKAFRGELVPQDPNDEPADKLLERIKTVRIEAEKLEKAAKKVSKNSRIKK